MMSVWEKESFFNEQDVLIIGGGFTGLWSALYLKKKKPSLKITIVERGIIPTGASSRNAGFACFGSLTEVLSDFKTMGEEDTLSLIETRFKGLEKIRKTFPKGIDFDLAGGYELLSPTQWNEELEDRMAEVNQQLEQITGSAHTYSLHNELIETFGFGGTSALILNKDEGYLHSGKLLRKLIQKVSGKGVQILTGMDIRNLNREPDGISLDLFYNGSSQHAVTVDTRKVLLCTNAFSKLIAPELDIVPARGQVLLTSSIPSLKLKGSFHSDEGFYYFRNLGDRVLLGGARNKNFEAERNFEMRTSEEIQNALENYLDQVILPHHRGEYRIENRWAGIMAMGSEKKPVIKKLRDHIFCAVRMSGMGVALAPMAARQIGKMILEEL